MNSPSSIYRKSLTQNNSNPRNQLSRFHSFDRGFLLEPTESWKQKCLESRKLYHEQNTSTSSSHEVGEEEKKVGSPRFVAISSYWC